MPGGHRGGESVDGGNRVHPADEQRQPLFGHRVGSHEVRGGLEAENRGGFADAVGRQVVSPARRQVGGAVAHPPGDADGQEAGQGAVDRGVRLAENEGQLRRIDERHPAEGVENLSLGECQVGVLVPCCPVFAHLLSSAFAQHPIVNEKNGVCNALQDIVPVTTLW